MNSLYLFDIKNPIRAKALAIIENRFLFYLIFTFNFFLSYFDITIFCFLLLNIFALFLKFNFDNDYKNKEMEEIIKKFSFNLELICNFFFLIEWVIKVIALGFFKGRNTYLNSGWNILDFLILISRYLSILLYI